MSVVAKELARRPEAETKDPMMTTNRLPKRSAREVPTAANRYIILDASEATQAVEKDDKLFTQLTNFSI